MSKMDGLVLIDKYPLQQYSLMLQQRLPQQIAYPTILPKGFPTIYKEWELDPMSNNKQWANNDIVRFNFMNMGKGVMDPMRSYIQFTVSTSSDYHGVGGLQIDSSAQSFISQLVLYSDNRQIQRLTQYDTAGAYFADKGLDQYITQGRQVQGYGYGSFDTMPFTRSIGNSMSSPRPLIKNGETSDPPIGISQSSSNIFPTIPNYYPQYVQHAAFNSIVNCSSLTKGHCTNSNPVTSGTDINGGSSQWSSWSGLYASMKLRGYANNIRSQYQAKFTQNKFPQSTSSIPNYQLLVSQNVSTNGTYPFYYNKNNPYQVQVRSNISPGPSFTNTSTVNTTPQIITTSNFGFNSLFCPYYTRGTFQPMISATIPQVMMYNGQFLQTKVPLYRRKFKIPLLSAVIGTLIPESQFLLIPLASIQKCLLQLTLSPYAMFTTGYCDVSQLDNIGMTVPQKRDYCIQRISYKLQTYHFMDQDVQTYIQTSLTRQISIISNFWSLSNQYQIPGGTPPNNTYIVGCNSTHLNQVVALFVANDYQWWPFCRKHYRLSNCITKFWSKIAVDYWPPQPYKGNGGNVVSNNYDDDNSQYIQNIYWPSSFMFTTQALPRINAYNFAINDRPYSPSNTQTFYDPSALNNNAYNWTAKSVNADTAMGMSWIHQNRVVGKAAYVINYTPFRASKNVLNGINVSSISNFELVFQSNTDNTFSRDQTLYIFTRSSGIVKYSKDGIKTYGRG